MRRLLILLLLSILGRPAAAEAAYRFEVEAVRFEAIIHPDGTVLLRHAIDFANSSFGQAIDIVDVGLPRPGYEISKMQASIDGHALSRIQPSEFVDPGVEVHLGSHAIPSGGRGQFVFEATVEALVFSDTTDDALASFQITPTWFGAEYVEGSTDLKIAVHFPEGVAPEQVLHQGQPFSNKALYQDHAVVLWEYPGTSFTGPHEVGVSFPREVMAPGAVIEVTILDLFWMWWEGNPKIRGWIGVVLGLIFFVFFLRFTAGTGWTLLVVILGVGGYFYFTGARFSLFCLFAIPLSCALMEWALRRKRKHYLPPILSVEGGGIKRGLTAPEAAALLQLPPGKVLTLVVFGLLKKGVFLQEKGDPLQVEVAKPYRSGKREKRRKAAGKHGIVLRGYEHEFITLVQESEGLPLKKIEFGRAMQLLYESVVDRVTGFDLEETRAYYRYVVAKAWSQAEALGEIEQRTEAVDRDLEWLLLDEGYDDRFGSWRTGGYHYRPTWARGPAFSVGDLASPATGDGIVPGFSDVTGSFAGWAEGIASDVSSAVLPGSGEAGGGFVDLSGVDTATGDIFEAMASSSGGGGGGGGGCACACAGCACACACAGGGR